MKLHQLFELTYRASAPEGSQAQIDLQAKFTCGTESVCVKGFYAGNDTYKIRFLPQRVGLWHYEVTGLVNDCGDVVCEPGEGHGMVKAVDTHFEHADGTIFHPFGTTVYALISQSDELIEQTMQTLSEAPFNKLRMCVFPKDYDFNKNEPTYYAFEKAADGTWDPSRPVYAFWDALDKHIVRLGEMGIQIDLILFHPYDRWGFDGMGLEKDKQYLDYLLRRLSAYPHIWWSLANEYELTKRSEEEWFAIEAFVAANDPYRHLLSCHNIFKIWDANRPLTTHASIQSKDFGMLEEWCKRYRTPVMLDECAYEGNLEHFWGCITGRDMTRRFWKAICSGAYCTHGETFYADDDILWWSRGGQLKGESPERIAFCRKIIESLPGYLEAEPSWLCKLLEARKLPEEARETILAPVSDFEKRLICALWNSGEDAESFAHSEKAFAAHIGTDCYLRFYDTRPIARDTLRLPADKTYTITLIDTWNMTMEMVATGVSGTYLAHLPGREDMALLAIAEA